MSHASGAKYLVSYYSEDMKPGWVLLEARALGSYTYLEKYDTKQEAIEAATKLARRDNSKAAFESKDGDRITATRDFR